MEGPAKLGYQEKEGKRSTKRKPEAEKGLSNIKIPRWVLQNSAMKGKQHIKKDNADVSLHLFLMKM